MTFEDVAWLTTYYSQFVVDTPYRGRYLEVSSEDYLTNDIVGRSNCDRILEEFEFLTVVDSSQYFRAVGIDLDDMEELSPEHLERLERLLDVLSDYGIYDDTDVSEREHEVIEAFISDDVPELLDAENIERATEFIASLDSDIYEFVFIENGEAWMSKDLNELYANTV